MYPRFAWVSSRTTDWPIRLRPRLRSVSRWFCFSLITDLIWVTLRLLAMTMHLLSPERHGRQLPEPLRGRCVRVQHGRNRAHVELRLHVAPRGAEVRRQ